MPALLRICAWSLAVCLGCYAGSTYAAEILVTNSFFGTVDKYDSETGELLQAGFFTAPDVASVPFLTGIVVNPTNNQVYVSGRQTGRIYVFDGLTGAPLAATETPTGIAGVLIDAPGTAPSGLTLDAAGNLYVTDNGGSAVNVFNTTTGSLVDSITSPLLFGPGGVGFDNSGNLYITNLSGTGTLVYDGSNVTQFAAPGANGPTVPSSVIVDDAGQVYVADVFGNGVLKYAADGTEITAPGGGAFIDISSYLPAPAVANPSSEFDAPSGLAFDADGNILVSILGQTNPGEFDPITGFPDLNGGLLLFSPDGVLLQTLGTKLPPLAGVAFAPTATNAVVPEPGTLGLAMVCGLMAWVWNRKRSARRQLSPTPTSH